MLVKANIIQYFLWYLYWHIAHLLLFYTSLFALFSMSHNVLWPLHYLYSVEPELHLFVSL